MDIEFIRQICISLPAVTEAIKWDNDLVFSVGGKMFCVVALDPPFRCSFKVDDEAFEEMSRQPGMIPAPYLARAKWVQVSDEKLFPLLDWKAKLKQSHHLVKARLTKKMRTELGLD
ncbi:MAG: MmcQ/YjbR family DNA-binding protein [Flavisolibacter sp.]|jgi:predicted DNA-binding protein (MmcQ/YjbR family)|nr:MmcQ/YjbR family DNA-binding protein [Flavisolibacter sp.]